MILTVFAIAWILAMALVFALVNEDNADLLDFAAITGFIVLCVTVIWCVIGSASTYSNAVSAKNSQHIIDIKTEQRDDLLATIRDEMSSDEYVKLITATSSDDITVIFGSGVSEFLIARAQSVIALNQSLNELVLSVEQKKVDVCNYVDNPFMMRIPFLSADCEL